MEESSTYQAIFARGVAIGEARAKARAIPQPERLEQQSPGHRPGLEYNDRTKP